MRRRMVNGCTLQLVSNLLQERGIRVNVRDEPEDSGHDVCQNAEQGADFETGGVP